MGRSIGDVDEYLASPNSGPWLFGRGVGYDFIGSDCVCELDVEPSLARTFMERMASVAPLFGYACTWEEKKHRNWVFAEVDGGKGGTSESFRGRDISRYVPGLYWLTLLPEALAKLHGVRLAEVSEAALEHVDLGGGQHLFRFYEHPDGWRGRTDAMDDLCARLPGVFNVHDVRRLVAGGVKSHPELEQLLRAWR